MSLDEESALTQEEQSKLSPFIWVDHDTSVSVIFSGIIFTSNIKYIFAYTIIHLLFAKLMEHTNKRYLTQEEMKDLKAMGMTGHLLLQCI